MRLGETIPLRRTVRGEESPEHVQVSPSPFLVLPSSSTLSSFLLTCTRQCNGRETARANPPSASRARGGCAR
jgi:hypothetical protein